MEATRCHEERKRFHKKTKLRESPRSCRPPSLGHHARKESGNGGGGSKEGNQTRCEEGTEAGAPRGEGAAGCSPHSVSPHPAPGLGPEGDGSAREGASGGMSSSL